MEDPTKIKLPYRLGSITEANGITSRKCRECREIKELNEENFVKRTDSSNGRGWRGKCRICYNKFARIRQEMTKGEKETAKRYRDKYKKTKALDRLVATAKGNAKRNGREFKITVEDVKTLWRNQEAKCYYTGRPMRHELGKFNDSVSLDRIDSSKGYIVGNICLCQFKVNIMKNNASIEELVEFCQDVLKTLKLNQ